jgi:predicted TIM-barrel fold metal-dependent hydrolase
MPLDFPIVDPHQHFWDPRLHYYPWLCDDLPIRFRYGDYAAIRRPYLPSDYLQDAAPFEVEQTVYIETEWNPDDPGGEIRYVDTLRRTTGFPTVAVGQAWLDQKTCEPTLEQHSHWGFVRGIRHKPRANTFPGMPSPGGMCDPAWQAGYALLQRYGLHFELQTPWWHLPEAAQLAHLFPNILIVLNHTGLPADRSVEGLRAWSQAINQIAQCPNVVVKISGLGLADASWDVESNRGIVLSVIALFGVERCMFASNFPVDSLCASFATIYRGYDEITQDFSKAERRALFRDNALRIYRMEESL